MGAVATTFDVDSPSFKAQVDRIARTYGKTARSVMLDQMRLWMNDLVRKTPPKTLSIGRNAVAKGVKKVFVPIMDELVLSFYRDRFGEQHPEFFDVKLEDMLDMHNRWRGRNGRVRRGPQGTLRFGNMTVPAKPHVSARDYRKFLKIKQDHVGSLKTGWLPGVRKFKGKAPKFVTRHTVQRGTAADKLDKKGNGYLMATNRLIHSPKKLRALVHATGRTRAKDIGKNLERRLEKMLKAEERR